jgi:cytochrome d ubiquinol oxidase subunit II
LAASAFIGAVFLAGDARRFQAPDLVAYFTRRTLIATTVFLLVGAGTLVVLRFDARYIFDGLWRDWSLGFTIATPALAVVTAILVLRDVPVVPRLSAIATVGSIVYAWGLAKHPYMLPTSVTVEQAAAAPDTLRWLLIVIGVALVLVLPPLAVLYRLDLRGALEPDHHTK